MPRPTKAAAARADRDSARELLRRFVPAGSTIGLVKLTRGPHKGTGFRYTMIVAVCGDPTVRPLWCIDRLAHRAAGLRYSEAAECLLRRPGEEPVMDLAFALYGSSGALNCEWL